MAEAFFPYERDARWRALLLPIGVTARDGVTVTDTTMRATFGLFSVETPLTNITTTKITGPHRWYTAVGVRLSFSDDGVTFGTNHLRGLSIQFEDKVRRVIGLHDHSSLWVSVADPEGLAAALD
ncbi:MAG: hypothetical protein ABJH68_20525 [Ilumatobacter sp.]|uniref:hypothetical protein n=1 Tax=Ilumatobacter sp. TaxID=1967498 RepID=UPI0032998980